jgi:site-specific DNA recombinase
MQDTSPDNLKVALYCRVSTEEQREGQTIESQVQELERFAHNKGWVVAGIYRDEGWSGSLLARPALDRLRDDASKGRFNAVLINDVDRLARDVAHLGVIKRDLERRDIKVIFKKLPGEQSPTQNLLINILGSFAEFERELISDRTRRGKRYKVEVRKQFLGPVGPYGFRYVPKAGFGAETGILEILPEEAAVVRRMYRWVSEDGLSSIKVVDRLNELKIPPRKGGTQWQKSTVLRILRSEVYAGVWHYNKSQLCEPRTRTSSLRYRKSAKSSARRRPKAEWIPITLPDHLRIVDPALWRHTQEQLTRNACFSPRNARHAYFLTGMVQCGGCGASYVGDPSHGTFAYRCSRRCKAYGIIRERDLNGAVWTALSKALQSPAIMEQAIVAVEVRDRDHSAVDPEHHELTLGLAQIEKEEVRILEAYRREILSPEQLAHELQSLNVRRAILQSQNSSYEQKPAISNQPMIRRSMEHYCKIASRRMEHLDWEKRREVLRLMLERIVFEGSRIRIRGIIPMSANDQAGLDALMESNEPGQELADDSALSNAGKPNASSEIANTVSYLHGRNVALAEESAQPSGRMLFELIATVERDNTAKLAASRTNLIKANAILRRKRLSHD